MEKWIVPGGKLRTLVITLMASFALLLAIPTSATAATFNNVRGSFDADVTTTLTYPSGHASFHLNAWSDKNCGGTLCATTHSIWMYDGSGRLLWSASSQSNRTYFVGSNVTKIVMKRDCSCAGHTYTQR